MTGPSPLVFEFAVTCPANQAFETWTDRIDLWWPRTHSRSGDPERIHFGSAVGEPIGERAADGTVFEWGRITRWEPPRRLSYRWYIGAERHEATDVDLTFTETNGETLIRLVHSGWEAFAVDGPRRREDNHRGWSEVLERFTAEAAG